MAKEVKVSKVPDTTYTLDKAKIAVYTNQGPEYGHPRENFSDIAIMWSVILGIMPTPEQVGLCMIATRLCREKRTHNVDNLIDIAGYAEATARITEDRPGIDQLMWEGLGP